MYWYYKIPLGLLVVALFVGLCVFLWRVCITPFILTEQAANQEVVSSPFPAPEVAPNADVTFIAPPLLDALPETQAETTAKTALPLPESQAVAPAGFSALPQKVAQTLALAENELKADNPKKARDLASSILTVDNCTDFDETWFAITSIIDRANKIFMNSKAPCPEKSTYTVLPGDNLLRIAGKLSTTVYALQRLNGLKATDTVIHPGNTFQYIAGKWAITVSKKHFVLCLFLDNNLYRVYRISTGRQDRTPSGTFLITQKLINPAWTPPGQNIPFGDPRNILGTRWIGLTAVEGTDSSLKGYGIHGTTEPESIGTAASLGCVRMLNEEVEELYSFIPDPASRNKSDVYVFINE